MRALAIAAILFAPLAAAHGAPPAYDPLVVEIHGFLHTDGAFREAAPDAGAVPFPSATPAAPGEPLRFAFAAPVRFAPVGGFEVELTLRAEAPLATGDGLELAIEPGGAPERVALPPVMAPGETTSVRVRLAGAASYEEGQDLALAVRALAPALAENALFVVTGANASRMDARDMRIPSVGDLGLQEGAVVEFLASEQFVPSRPATVHTFKVAHDAVALAATSGTDRNATYVVLLGLEAEADMSRHAFPDRERRIAAAHAFTVNDALVRVHPGVGVAVPVERTPVRVACVANCPADGYVMTIDAEGNGAREERPSALIPPSRETRDIPVSKDEPPAKETPLAPLAPVAAAVVLAALRRRR